MARLNFDGDASIVDLGYQNNIKAYYKLGWNGARAHCWRQRIGGASLFRLGFDEYDYGTFATTKTDIWLRYRFRIVYIPTVGPIRYGNTRGNAAGGIGFWLNTNGTLSFDNSFSGAGTTFATSAAKTVGDQIEVKMRLRAHVVGDDAKVQIIVDGVELYNNFSGLPVLVGSGVGLNGATLLNSIAFELLNIDNGADYDISNISVDDSEFPNDTQMTFIPINGAGTYTNWLGGSTNWRHHAAVIIAGYPAVTTTLLNTRHSFSLPTLASQGITGTIKSIKVLATRGTGAGSLNGKLFVRKNGVDIDTTGSFTYSDNSSIFARFSPSGWSNTDTLEVGVISGGTAGTYGLRSIGLLVEHETPFVEDDEDSVQINLVNYTGAAAGFTVTFPYDPDLVFINARTAIGQGTQWFRASFAPRPNNSMQYGAGIVIQADKMYLLDNNVAYNNIGTVYEVLIMKNPSGRFIKNIGWSSAYAITPLFINTRDVEVGWQPDAAINIAEGNFGVGGQITSYKVNGLPDGSAQSFLAQQAPQANQINSFLPTGVRYGDTALFYATMENFLVAFKENFYNNKLAKFTAYTGDGAASRVIPLDFGGGTPNWVMISPQTTAQRWMRSSNHAQSMDWFGSGTSATAITAFGVDSITVGINSNVLGTLYAVFAFATGTDAPSINEPSGIYFIDPTARHDTLYTRVGGTFTETVDVKIPNPLYRTHFVGDE